MSQVTSLSVLNQRKIMLMIHNAQPAVESFDVHHTDATAHEVIPSQTYSHVSIQNLSTDTSVRIKLFTDKSLNITGTRLIILAENTGLVFKIIDTAIEKIIIEPVTLSSVSGVTEISSLIPLIPVVPFNTLVVFTNG